MPKIYNHLVGDFLGLFLLESPNASIFRLLSAEVLRPPQGALQLRALALAVVPDSSILAKSNVAHIRHFMSYVKKNPVKEDSKNCRFQNTTGETAGSEKSKRNICATPRARSSALLGENMVTEARYGIIARIPNQYGHE